MMFHRSRLHLLLVACACWQATANVFEEEPEDQYLVRGSSSTITFTCRANLANPVYTWRKEKTQLSSASDARLNMFGGTLEIQSPRESDAGEYQCIVTSSEGKIGSNYGKLQLAYIDELSQGSPVSTIVGEGVVVPCPTGEVVPDNSVRYYWTRNDGGEENPSGTIVEDATHYYSQQTGDLYLVNPVSSDGDNYQCNIRSKWQNDDGSVVNVQSTAINVHVDSTAGESVVAPEFLLRPDAEKNGVLGANVVLECVASGNPTPEILWTKPNGEPAKREELSRSGRKLTVKNITENDAGTYRCTATNSQGSRQAETELRLQYAPRWTGEIQPQNVDVTDTATLRCSADAEPPARFKWAKDATQLVSGVGRVVITGQSDGSRLQIFDFQDEDTGMYQCVAENDHGVIFSNAKLTAQRSAPTFIQHVPEITKAAIDNSATINCEVDGSPAPTVTWFKGSDQLKLTDRLYLDATTQSLHVNHVQTTDSGEYTCQASNVIGQIESTGLLQVYEQTVLTQRLAAVTTREAGDFVDLVCTATFDTRLKLNWDWTRNGAPEVGVGNGITVNGGYLTIQNLNSDHSGTYLCCATTEVGEDCSAGDLTVLGPPDGPSRPRAVPSATTPTTIDLVWDEPDDNGHPIQTYRVEVRKNKQDDESWEMAATEPEVVNTTSCRVTGLLPFNKYQFRVSATNRYGDGAASDSSPAFRTSPAAPNVAPTDVSGGGGKPGQLHVTWKPIAKDLYGEKTVQYSVEVRKYNTSGDWKKELVSNSTAEHVQFKVDSSEVYEPYDARIRAQNSQGNGPFSEIVIVHSGEIKPEQSPMNFRVIDRKAYSLQLEWDALEDKNGHTLGYNMAVVSYPLYETGDDMYRVENWMNYTTPNDRPRIVVDGLQPDYPYSYQAQAFNSAGTGPWSGWQPSTYTEKPPPTLVPVLRDWYVNKQTLTVTWDALEEQRGLPITGYKVEIWNSTTSVENAMISRTRDTRIDIGVPTKDEYFMRLSASNAGGDGPASDKMPFSTAVGVKAGQYGGAPSGAKANAHLLFVAIAWSALKSVL